ncbi:hypothetical protein ACVBEQ_08070 [Nakamurella sp. GG22]
MTAKREQFIPGVYRQHILAGVIIAGKQPIAIDSHGGGTGAEGSHLTATFGQQLMITLYDMAAATVYSQAWLADEHQWIFNGLPAEIPTIHGHGSMGPALSVRAHGDDDRKARYDSVSRTAIVRVGSMTWTVQDRAAADSMREAWQYIAELAPLILDRQAPARTRRNRPSRR